MLTPAELLKPPADFSGDIEEGWTLGPCIRSRDSELITLSNADAIVKAMEGLPDWEVRRCSHWGFGWVEHLSFKVLNEDGTETEVMKRMQEIQAALEHYPVLDDEDHSRREYEAACDNIGNIGSCFVLTDAADDWKAKVFTWLWANDQRELDEQYPSERSVRNALRSLGLHEPEDQ